MSQLTFFFFIVLSFYALESKCSQLFSSATPQSTFDMKNAVDTYRAAIQQLKKPITLPFFNFIYLFRRSSFLYMKPNHTDSNKNCTRKVFAFFIGGTTIAGKHYKSMCSKLIEKVYNNSKGAISLHIVIVPLETTVQLALAFTKPSIDIIRSVHHFLKTENPEDASTLEISDIWAIGHSAGGFISLELASKYAKGCISLAAIRPNNYDSQTKPFLYIASERDGFLPVSLFSRMLYLRTTSISEITNSLHHSVCIAFGINHLQVGNGESTPTIDKTHRNDFKPIKSVSLEAAHEKIAEIASNFLLIYENLDNLGSDAIQVQTSCKDELIKYRREAYQYLFPFQRVLKNYTHNHLLQEWHQYLHSDLPIKILETAHFSSIKCETAEEFMFSKPSVDFNDGTQEIVVKSSYISIDSIENILSYTGKPFSIQLGIQHVGNFLSVKSTTVDHLINPTTENLRQQQRIPNAATFNRQTMERAISMVPDNIRNEYLQFGRKLTFGDDILVTLPHTWISAKFTVINNTLAELISESILSTPVYIGNAPDPNQPKQLWESGVRGPRVRSYYVKLITLEFALEWIYVWSKR